MSPKILIICGPTASGKTALALRLAAGSPVSLLSADSRQVYTDLSLITGKDIPPGFVKRDSDLTFNRRPVPVYVRGQTEIWGLDLLTPSESFSAAEFIRLGKKVFAHEQKRQRRVIVVGGTGFYLSALTHPERLGHVTPDPKLRQDLSRLTLSSLKRRLQKTAPARFTAMNHSDQNNPRRLIRALEIALSPAAPAGSVLAVDQPAPSFVWAGLRLPLERLKQKIKTRIITRLHAGAVVEVKKLLDQYPDRSLPIYTSLGVKSVMEYLDGKNGPDDLLKRWVNEEIDYAKRQLTWFKKQSEIIWYDQDRLSRLKLPS